MPNSITFESADAGPTEANYLGAKPKLDKEQQIQKRLTLQQRMMSSDKSTLEEAKKTGSCPQSTGLSILERRQVAASLKSAPQPKTEIEFAEVRKVDPKVAEKQMSSETKSNGNLRWAHYAKKPKSKSDN